ncbi:PD-(D/E)XK nuclease family protein [Cytophagaceae bacterium DM2B3-1]|uniref:PD-(D/E)XK nuclease family protein n=1 Tax=Xanthocytophaga flava TaxID=3048013 RepID=A0ABT7CXK5_9BACT|nr:PD-(D/E)XK nuclease family protein [Xanthocytophaga flavus]MDJ1497662.1 PD-(D/E)XK nuclease family protein [Xanthocytophaga flavus]
MEKIEAMLWQAKQILQKAQPVEQTFESNLFQILGLEKNEVKHSRLIGYLLNPLAGHGHKDVFAKLFLSGLGMDYINTTQLRVELEKCIPVSNRRIDIYLTDGVHRIIIENKIEAADQPDQLWDYFTFGTSELEPDGKLTLVYLTPRGSDPSLGSVGNWEQASRLQAHLKTVCYRQFICHWIEQCMACCSESSADSSSDSRSDHSMALGKDHTTSLLNNLRQYHRTIKNMLDINPSHSQKHLRQLVLSQNYSRAAFELAQVFASIKKEYLIEFWREGVEKVKPILTGRGWRIAFFAENVESYITLTRKHSQGLGLSLENLCEPDQGFFGIYRDKLFMRDKDALKLLSQKGLQLQQQANDVFLTWQYFPSALQFNTASGWERLIADSSIRQEECQAFVLQLADRYESFLDSFSPI